ncbi:MAG: AraC family transcriptional regulator ligand-binding domain-containing protein [Pseudomonadota bacterium]|nr:AraC family transcriptional regulator ligand-binding domain-containing protein [Pseudomonadota bacterium]
MDVSRRHDPGMPGAYMILLLDVISRWGISEQTLLHPFDLKREQLADPACRLPATQFNDVLQRAHLLTGESSLAYHLGTQMRISTHGFIGFAIMTASNATQAIGLASRFIGIRLPYCQLGTTYHPPTATIKLMCDLPLEPLRSELLLSLLIGILQIGEALLQQHVKAKISLDFAEPDNFHKFSKLLDSSFVFNQPIVSAEFDSGLARLPLVTADPVASQLALTQCESELSALGQRDRLAVRVREILISSDQGYPQIEQVAAQLCMSDRTLKRQLATEDTSYSALLEEVRHRQAIGLLSRTDLSLERIAEQLGYSDVANFNRAFRRWTGKTPGRWRREPKS